MADKPEPPAEEIIRYDKDAKTRIATITFERPDYLNAPTIAARLRYADLLHRHIDPAGGAAWVSSIQGGYRDEQIIAGLLASPEYRSNVPRY